MAVAAGDIDGFTLMTGVTGATHKTDARMAVDATHPGEVMGVRWHAFDMPAIGQSQTDTLTQLFRNIDFCKACVIQRYPTRAGVATETPRIGNAGG